MKKPKKIQKKNNVLDNVTVEGSLGALAYGDLAFLQWRALKKAKNKGKNK